MADSLFDPRVLYEVLKGKGLLPEWSKTLPYDGSTGTYFPQTNRLVAREPDNYLRKDSLAHEMTHAVQNNLLKSTARFLAEKKWKEEPMSAQEEQFLQAAQKIFNDQYGRVGQYDGRQAEANNDLYRKSVDGLYKNKSPDKNYQEYRTRPNEAQAFGVGSMTHSQPSDADRRANPHMDASMATDFSVLLGMYQQLPKTVQDLSAVQRQSDITENRKGKGDSTEYRYEDPFYQDPFGTL